MVHARIAVAQDLLGRVTPVRGADVGTTMTSIGKVAI
jgi:hypothetical protein